MNWKLLALFTGINLTVGVLSGLVSTLLFEHYVGIDESPEYFFRIQVVLGVFESLVIYGILGFFQEKRLYLHAIYLFSITSLLNLIMLSIVTKSVLVIISVLTLEPFYFLVSLCGVSIGRCVNMAKTREVGASVL